MNLSYITQMMWTTKFPFKNCSHSQNFKIRNPGRPSPSNSPEIALHTFRHSTLILGRSKLLIHWTIRTCVQDLNLFSGHLTWTLHKPASNSRSSHCDTATSCSFPLASITKRLQVSIIEYYKFVFLLFSGLSIAHKKNTKVIMYDTNYFGQIDEHERVEIQMRGCSTHMWGKPCMPCLPTNVSSSRVLQVLHNWSLKLQQMLRFHLPLD